MRARPARDASRFAIGPLGQRLESLLMRVTIRIAIGNL